MATECVESKTKSYEEKTPDGALVVRLGETGLDRDLTKLFKRKKQKVIVVTATNPYPENRAYLDSWPVRIDMGFAFGDACVPLEGFPIRILPTSGVMQVAAYESLNVEVFSLLGGARADRGGDSVGGTSSGDGGAWQARQ